MQISMSPQPVVALVAGIAILVFPKLLNYILAIYLIIFGISRIGPLIVTQ